MTLWCEHYSGDPVSDRTPGKLPAGVTISPLSSYTITLHLPGVWQLVFSDHSKSAAYGSYAIVPPFRPLETSCR